MKEKKLDRISQLPSNFNKGGIFFYLLIVRIKYYKNECSYQKFAKYKGNSEITTPADVDGKQSEFQPLPRQKTQQRPGPAAAAVEKSVETKSPYLTFDNIEIREWGPGRDKAVIIEH